MGTVRKVVFPVAGLGTRFLPATKASPKEMLPIVDKPLIQYAAEEAVAAGIDELIFVTSSSKRAIEDHFDRNHELEMELQNRGKSQMLKEIQHIVPDSVTCVYIRQPEALGLGHAVLCAKSVVGDEPFAVILADDLINGETKSCMEQMVEVFKEQQCSLLCVEEVDPEDTNKYGIVESTHYLDHLKTVDGIVEKPAPEVAPSNLAVLGRYILTPGIFEILETTERGAGGEIQLTDAISDLLKQEQVLAYQYRGRRYDCGSKVGYLQATVDYALDRPDLSDEFYRFLKNKFET
ncbi:MAG: UTP--glucose-1-phosphate uridylyltransferase GalU [Gammaproteobacteria bacterium]